MQLDQIDWRRVAKPQPDGYDIAVTRAMLAEFGPYAVRPRRAIPESARLVWEHGITKFVTLADNVPPSAALKDMTDGPRIAAGLALLDLWPDGREQSAQMLLALAPLTMGHPQESHGCTCGNYGDDWGWIYVTADNAWGFAEGIVHETAHWKLRAFGVWFEEWTPFLLQNRLEDRYVSPVRKDMARPMGAVLHAQFSYVHVAKMCAEMLRAAAVPQAHTVDWTALQLTRIAEGQATLQEHAVGTPGVGDAFLAGFYDWTEEVLADGRAVVDAARLRVGGGA